MVKSLKIFGHSVKWLLLLVLLFLLGSAIWLHQGKRSLSFARPWITSAVNSPGAPYAISIGDVTIDWTNMASLGKLRIRDVVFARHDGSVFATFPELFATIDPIGFLPERRLLHRVILRQPRIYATRNTEGNVVFGFENSQTPMPLAELVAFLTTSDATASSKPVKPASLPFSSLMIDKAHFTFTDEKTKTEITSDAFSMRLQRKHGSFDAALSLPFMVDAEPVMISAGLRALPETGEHVLALRMDDLPSRLICLFDTCPEGIEAEGSLDGDIAVGILDKDLSIHGFNAKLATQKAKLKAPQWFAETLKIGASTAEVEGDWSKQVIILKQSRLQLEDTQISATGNIRKDEKGWYVVADATSTRLDVRKIYKYWPLTMAPDSRTWVTGKLKSGYSAGATLKLNLTPEDLAAEYFPQHSVDAVVDAREITFDYLPGFPKVEKMNGIAHFTATTLKVDGKGGSLLSDTQITEAELWCPQLMSDNNPMEATISLNAPASDVATMLALKHFPFDDAFGLNPKEIKGNATAKMKLKFDAFSGKESSNPDEIHLEAVDYDIVAAVQDMAQKNVYGGYDVHSLNGTLKADNKGIGFEGVAEVGEAGRNAVSLKQTYGQPLQVSLKGQPPAKGKPAHPLNDVAITYNSAATIPAVEVSGKRLDASVSYSSKENSLLANFPAMDLSVNLDELVLTKDAPFTAVKGTLKCTPIRCESAQFEAKAGNADIRAAIHQVTGKRQFVMSANDAGATLKALDITDRMMKGSFELRGDYDDAKTPPHLDARLIIANFTLKNSEILGRIFAIGSLTGLSNALTGSGIAFEKLSANLGSQAGVITVDKGVARGASMGITFDGQIDTNTTRLNLKGVVAPAYALNSILGKIPIIGTIAGGEEGLIAFNYAVKGSYASPDVSVNPLSGLTPGFLRGIFGGEDGKSSKENDDKQQDNKRIGPPVKSHVKRSN